MTGEIVGAVTIRAHFADMGGIAMGGFEVGQADLLGGRAADPAHPLVLGGKPVKSTLKLLYDNTRLGYLCVPDIVTQVRSLEFGETLLQESIDKYGLEAYLGSIRYALRRLGRGHGRCAPTDPRRRVRGRGLARR